MKDETFVKRAWAVLCVCYQLLYVKNEMLPPHEHQLGPLFSQMMGLHAGFFLVLLLSHRLGSGCPERSLLSVQP